MPSDRCPRLAFWETEFVPRLDPCIVICKDPVITLFALFATHMFGIIAEKASLIEFVCRPAVTATALLTERIWLAEHCIAVSEVHAELSIAVNPSKYPFEELPNPNAPPSNVTMTEAVAA